MNNEWIVFRLDKVPLDKTMEFKGEDWTPFTCVGVVKLNKKGKRIFHVIKDGIEFSERNTAKDLTHYRELK